MTHAYALDAYKKMQLVLMIKKPANPIVIKRTNNQLQTQLPFTSLTSSVKNWRLNEIKKLNIDRLKIINKTKINI